MKPTSIVTRISIALACIVTMAMGSMLVSYWLTERSDSDALAINLAGSLRVQSYRVGLLLQQTPRNEAAVKRAVAQLDETWHHPLFSAWHYRSPVIKNLYNTARENWQATRQRLETEQLAPDEMRRLLERQVGLLDQLVSAIQDQAETNIRSLRLVQVAALFLVLLISAIAIYWLKTRVQEPLSALTQTAKRLGQGNFSYKATVSHQDELGVLAMTLNKMSDAVGSMHERMEEQIEQQTRALQRSNTTLQFLYETARAIIEHEPEGIDYDGIVTRLAGVVEADDLELCLMTTEGERPYLQIKPEDNEAPYCDLGSCVTCIKGGPSVNCSPPADAPQTLMRRHAYPMLHDQKHFGVLVCRIRADRDLEQWQEQLIQSVADQLAVALSLQSREDDARRLSLMHERTVIARELHDSLAQSLSYLKIQVTRLDRAIAGEKRDTMEDVAGELREGLNTAYRQLRELLTTFRLRVEEGAGLFSALQTTIAQARHQTQMHIELDYQLSSLPLTPNEEIHLLQIVREASQNAMHHSGGDQLKITLIQKERRSVHLSVEDNGAGIPGTPEKLNHYGLAIMQERGKNLGGVLEIRRRPSGGTGVYFDFVPEYLRQRATDYRAV